MVAKDRKRRIITIRNEELQDVADEIELTRGDTIQSDAYELMLSDNFQSNCYSW